MMIETDYINNIWSTNSGYYTKSILLPKPYLGLCYYYLPMPGFAINIIILPIVYLL